MEGIASRELLDNHEIDHRDECDLTVNGVLGGHSHQSY